MLELTQIDAGYPGSGLVLRDVSLCVPDASVVALLGANGAGKTTLLRIASGLLRPAAGQLLIDGQDFSRRSPHELASAGVCHVPEGRGIFPTLTVRENLLVQGVGRTPAESIERAVMAFPRLGERLDQTAGTMSGGEQQMLALARTYVQNPRIVLLDEVSMGLAPRVVDEIFEYLDRLRGEGTSMLLVEQYAARALAIADYAYVLTRGEVSFVGEPAELTHDDLIDEYLGTTTTTAAS